MSDVTRKPSLLELGDGEKVCNSSLVDPHLENSEVPDLGRQFNACVTIPTDGPSCVAYILQAPCDKHTVVRISTIQVQFVGVCGCLLFSWQTLLLRGQLVGGWDAT